MENDGKYKAIDGQSWAKMWAPFGWYPVLVGRLAVEVHRVDDLVLDHVGDLAGVLRQQDLRVADLNSG